MTKFRLFKLQIRLDNIARKLMDDNAVKMDINEHNAFVHMHEKGFCSEFKIEKE